MAPHPTAEQLFADKGEMAMLMRSYDWSQTSLGAPEQWSQSLKTAVRIMLTSRQPMFVWWGEDLINLYNDAYKSIVGGKHPTALGQPAAIVWQEIWEQVSPRAESALCKNEGTYDEALLLIMERNGYPEETYYTFSYSPIPDDQSNTSGIICANTDDTQRIIGERQLALLRELAANTADARSFDQACMRSASCLETNLRDLPFALIYLVDPDQSLVTLAGTSGIDRHHPAVPEIADLSADSSWPFAEVIRTQKSVVVTDLAPFGTLPSGAWTQPPQQAVVVPIAAVGRTGRSGILVAGLNPFRLFDDSYRRFIDLVASQISASIGNANTYEEERKRAEALAELDRAKTAFFSNVSHEFRTPLTLMLSPLEELAQTVSDRLQPPEREQLQLIQRNGLRLQKLVNMLLDFSRIEAGRVRACYEPTDLSAYTTELASVFRSLVERAGMSLIIDCPPLPQPVDVDREMWEKIVLNLVSNAFKFTFTGSITVQLRAVNQIAELSIIDTGVGIPEAELPRLFERFHRISGMRSRTYEGSGIGLALVHELVKLHHGTIQVTSQLDQGTTFTIAVPFGSAHLSVDRIETNHPTASTRLESASSYLEEAWRWLPDADPEPTDQLRDQVTEPNNNAPPFSSPPSCVSPARVLLVDDNADMRNYVKRLLSQYWQVETASNGLEALESVAQRLPDLVLSDVMMPHLDGFGLLRELRQDLRTQEIPIILLSARAGEESRIEGLAAGADDYLIKPFSARELLARVEANLKLAQLRREVKTAIQRSEERSQLAIQIAQLGTWRYDLKTNQVELDERMCEIWGEPAVSLPFAQIIACVHPDDRDRVIHAVNTAINPQSSGAYEIDYRIVWKDGSERWIAVNGQATFTGIGNNRSAVELFGTALDITDRKQADAALRESEELKQRILENSPDCIKLLNLNYEILYISAGGLRLLEIADPTAVIQTNWLEFWQGEERDQAEAALAAAKAGRTGQFRGVYPTRKGTLRWWDSVITPIRDAAGQIVQLVTISRDVTQKKQAEDLLRQSEERFRNMADNAPVMIWVTDTTGYCTYLSQSWYDFTGQTEVTGLGRGWMNAVHPEDIETAKNIFLFANERQEAFRLEYRLRHKTGKYHWAIDAASPWFGVEGEFQGYIGSVIDISDRKQAEAEREQLLVREQAAREQAQTANRIKDEFLAVLSHELRSPLNPILGWSSLLLQGNLKPTQAQQALKTIERNAKLQIQLIDDLLDISRILQGKLTLNVLPVQLSSLITAAVETVRLAIDAKAIQLVLTIEPEVGQALGDATRLQQVIWNLLSNAVKFTPAGGQIKVCLSKVTHQDRPTARLESAALINDLYSTAEPPATAYAQVQVSDTGKGIHPDFLPYVFEHFRQEDSATTRKFGGLGLGLAIVRQIVELHGGTVWAESEGEGRGATFTVQLPLLQSLPLDTAEAVQTSPDRSNLLPLTHLRVLIVDDEFDSRDFVAFIVEQAGATVTAVGSAMQVLQLLKTEAYDVLLSDIAMPEIDGYTLIRQIRSLPIDSDQLPAIALTAYAGEMNQNQAIAAGFQQHIAKPVEPGQLISQIVHLKSKSQ